MKITLTIGDLRYSGELYENETASRIAEMIPFSLRLSRWGDEYYGSLDMSIPESDDSTDLMKVGELAFWPPGEAFCLFFGPTPASTGSEPRMASPGNPFGLIEGDFSALKKMSGSIVVNVDHE